MAEATQTKTTIAIDPVTRIEGHLKAEVVVENGKVVDAKLTGGMYRGFESILRGRRADATQRQLTEAAQAIAGENVPRGQESLMVERAIARRRFQPAEYLADASSGVRGFPPGATAPLVFEVADPGREAVAFEFRFLAAEGTIADDPAARVDADAVNAGDAASLPGAP